MRPFHRFVTLLLLLVYAGTGTSALPAVVMAAACLDGSHEVRVVHSEHGMQVRLHHGDEKHFTPEVADHSSSLARFLVRMCAPAREGDHSLSTKCVSSNALVSREDAKRATQASQEVDTCATIQLLALLPSSRQAHPVCPPRETKAPQGQHVCVTTVRLLI